MLDVAAQQAVPDQGSGPPAVRALRELEAEQRSNELGCLCHEARRAERSCQGPAALSAPTSPVKALSEECRILAAGQPPRWDLNPSEKAR